LAEQERRFPNHAVPDLRAAGLWMALRPMLQSYPDLLLRCARLKLTSDEYRTFHADVEIIGRMRRVARGARHKCSKQLNKARNEKEKAEILLEQMSTDLSHLTGRRRNPALGLLLTYTLELDELLTLTHGELLEKSERVRNVSNSFFT